MAIVYTSRIMLVRFGGGVREATLPIDGTIRFGMHDEVAEHYGMGAESYEPHATTLDYVVAATGG